MQVQLWHALCTRLHHVVKHCPAGYRTAGLGHPEFCLLTGVVESWFLSEGAFLAQRQVENVKTVFGVGLRHTYRASGSSAF